MRQQITRSEYYQIIGLLTLADGHNRRLKEIERAVAEVLDAESSENTTDYFGHISDTVYGGFSAPDADNMLRLLHITVEKP